MVIFRMIAKALRWVYFAVQDPIIARWARWFRSRNQIRAQWAGADRRCESALVAVYVHFDPQGVVHDYVLYQIRELMAAGFRVTFVSNSPVFPDASRERVAPFCRTVLWRFNVGYDFGAYKDGIDAACADAELDSLILMNDSTYGPFWPLAETLSAVDRSKFDFWGIVDSWEQRYHIQSFFMLFFAKSLQASAFRKFWQELPYVNNRGWVIRNAEITLTQTLALAGLRGGVLAPYWSVADTIKDALAGDELRGETDNLVLRRLRIRLATGGPMNPMHYFWDTLILKHKAPFLKRELIKLNPAGLPWVEHWPDVIRAVSDYDVTMITRHLGLASGSESADKDLV